MCKKAEEKPSCHKHQTHQEKKGCCENEQEKVQTSEYNHASKVEQTAVSDYQFIAFTYIILHQLYEEDIDNQSFTQAYSPPLIEHDIPVQVQSFLL